MTPSSDAGSTGVSESRDADAAKVEGKPVPSERKALSRERIVMCAIDYVDQHGLAGLSMRRLGAALGVEAMALYRYVPSRDDLLDAIVDTFIEELDDDDEVFSEPQYGWQDFMQRLAHGIRRIALAHPHAFPLLASRPAQAPWLRPPLRSLRWVDQFLVGLIDEGFSDEAAVAAYRGFTSFLLGHLLLETVVRGADAGVLDQHDPTSEGEDPLAAHPTLERLQDSLALDESFREFEESLESLLLRLTQVLTEG